MRPSLRFVVELLALTVVTVGVVAVGQRTASAASTAGTPKAGQCARSGCGKPHIASSERPDLTGVLEQLTSESVMPRNRPKMPQAGAKALSPERLSSLVASCAPRTPANLVRSLVATESGGYALLLATNGAHRRVFSPPDADAATRTLAGLIAQGANVDIGLMQLNSATLARMNVAPGEALDPCRNLAIGAQIFDRAYAAAFARRAPTSPLWSASSIYNTGDPVRGLHNGYAGRIQARLRSSSVSAG